MEKSSAVKHYYVAVGSPESKLPTVLDLLRALQSRPLSIGIVCGSRDALDKLARSLQTLRATQVHILHSDLPAEERSGLLADFQQRIAASPDAPSPSGIDTLDDRATAEAAGDYAPAAVDYVQQALYGSPAQSPPAAEQWPEQPEQPQRKRRQLAEVLLMTDACLRALEDTAPPLHLPLLIHFDLPSRKDTWLRRLNWVLGSKGAKGRSSGIAICCVVAGEAADFRLVEGFLSAGRIEVMPVQVEEIFLQQ